MIANSKTGQMKVPDITPHANRYFEAVGCKIGLAISQPNFLCIARRSTIENKF